MNSQDIIKAWHEVFPNSAIFHRNILGSDMYSMRLAKDASEVSGGIMDNDPLTYRIADRGDGSLEEFQAPYMLIKPNSPHMAYSTVKMRKATIKQADYAKLVKRFQAVRSFVMENASNLHNVHFDITTK